MGYRSFIDATGVQWQAWDIIPRLAERRAAQRRSAVAGVDRERRDVAERRRRDLGRMALTSGLHAGWLCFAAAGEKRRLAPIPSDWLRCAIATLEDYLHSAVPATPLHQSIESHRMIGLQHRPA